MKIRNEILNTLHSLADSRYRQFHAALVPDTTNILGVRIPQLRQLAKELIRRDDWRSYVETTDTSFYEETMLQGMIIGRVKMPWKEKKNLIQGFIPRIRNWAVCDIFCGELRQVAKKEREAVWVFIQPYLNSPEEFELRFGIVMLLHFIDEEHLPSLFAYADRFCHEGYYARMAMAWVLSICYVRFPVCTMNYLKRSLLDKWTYNKALQKAIESLRVSQEDKSMLKSLKRKERNTKTIL